MTEEQRFQYLKKIEASLIWWEQKWIRFNWKDYFNDLQWKWFYKYFCLLFGFTFLLKPLQSVFDEYIVYKLIVYTPKDSVIAELLLGGLAVYTVWFFCYQISKNLIISASSVISSVTIFLFYWHFFLADSDYTFYRFSVLRPLSYATVFVLFILVRFSSYRSFFYPMNALPSQLSFVEDAPSLTKYEDAFGNTAYAANLAAHINATVTEQSFAIAILGGWGTGKTDFLDRLKTNFSSVNSDNILLDFNPWKVKSDAIIEEFFRILSEALRPLDQSIIADIKDYSRRILQTGKEAYFRTLDVVLNDMAGDDSLQKQYEKINKAIKLTGKRIIVIVDDLDRLTGKEVMEVLRIIRNTANFTNTFFVVGMDKKYTIQVMVNAKDFAYEEEYLKKIFQLTVMLPAFKKEVLVQEAGKLLITADMDVSEREAISTVLKKLSFNQADPVNMFFPAIDPSHIIEKMLLTMRDLKRFANSFKLAYQILKGNIELLDLFVLELIRTRDVDAYNLIRDRSLLTFDVAKTSEYILDVTVWDEGYGKKDNSLRSTAEISNMKQAIEFLLAPSDKNARKFADMGNFYLYFSFQHFNLIKLKEFNELLGQDGNTIYTQFKTWISENKGAELSNILNGLDVFSNKEELLKMVTVYMRMEQVNGYWWGKARNLVFDKREVNKEQYFGKSDELFTAFLQEIAADKSISNTVKAYLFNLFLKEEIELPGGTGINKVKLQEFLYEFLIDELDISSDIQTILSVLYHNWEDLNPDTRVIMLNDRALQLVKDRLLTNNDLFKDYITRIIRPYYTPYNGAVVFEPFVGRIFNDLSQFLKKVHTTSFTDEDLKILKIEVINRIESFVAGGGHPFRIENVDHKRAIESVMRNNGISIEPSETDLDL